MNSIGRRSDEVVCCELLARLRSGNLCGGISGTGRSARVDLGLGEMLGAGECRDFNGIFFEHVIICEADADCMFYQSALNLPSISGDCRPDALFVHAAGEHRMAKLAETLRSLDVPVTVVADIDILDDEGTFRNLFEKLGRNWEEVRTH